MQPSSVLGYFNPEKPPRIYVHFPFCIRKCAYCSFYSVPFEANRHLHRLYFERLLDEVGRARLYFKGEFPSIYIGGGTPNFPDSLPFLERILDILGSAREVTVECNPSFLSTKALKMLAGRVTRLSVGIQSLSGREKERIGRVDDTRNFYSVLLNDRRKSSDFPVMNLDFIINALPKESFIARFERFARYCDQTGHELPEHISLYSLQVEASTPLASLVLSGKIRLPTPRNQARNLLSAWAFLERQGYEHYEISAFARQGRYCEHNVGYWTGEDFLGLGCQAASRVHCSDGSAQEIKCVQDVEEYSRGFAFSGYDASRLDGWQVALELLLTGLRTRWGVSVSELEKRCGRELLSSFERLGGVCVQGDRAFLEEGQMIFCEWYIRRMASVITP